MKIVLIALLCAGVALARVEEWRWLDQNSPQRQIQDSAFRSGREYQFFYNGQLSTGIAGASKQHAANRIQSLVTVVFKSQNHALMRLEKVRVGKMNRDIPNPRKIMPFDAFEDVQIEQHLKEKLERTVKFTYTGGLVHDIVFDSHEDPWSANIKRGVLNLLQVNLQQQRRVDTAEEARLTNNARYNRAEDEKSNFYRVMEETLEGECETLYTIQQQPGSRHSSQPVLNVTKSINFEKCNKRPQIKYNFRFADQCPTCDSKYNEDEKFLKSSTVAKYNITGDKQAFLIEAARVDSEYVFVPFNEEANAIVTYVNQTLVLVKTGPAQNLPEPQNPVESDSDMIFTLDWDVAYEKFHMKGDNELHRLVHDSQQGVNKVELAKKFVQKMTSQMKEQLDDDILQQFTRLVQLMRMCKEEELEQIFGMQGQSQEEEKKLKNIIPQALGTCGTKHCTKLLTHKIRQGQISPLRGAFAVKSLLQNRVASQEIINELIQLAESDKARESEQLKRSCWLTAGSLINALCTANEDQLAVESKKDNEKLCPRDVKDKYVKTLFNKLRQASNWQDKTLMLKSVGNAGLEAGIFELEKIIRQSEGPQQLHVRFEAITALHQLKDSVPKKIQRILMPIALNRREYPTIRSAASHILLQTKPERSILDQLAHNLVTEPSHQFAAFLYSQMQSYANSTNPCEQQLATDMTLALRHAKKINAGLGYSRMFHWSMHNEEQKVGLDLDFDAVYSNISSIPRHLGVALHANGLGFWQRYLATVNLFNEGLEPLIRQYINEDAVSDFFASGSLDQLLRRHPRSTQNQNDYQQELNDIFSKHLKIRTRDYSHEHNNEPKAYASATFKGQSVAFLPITKEFVQQMIQESGANLRQLKEKLQQGLPVDYTTIAELHDMQYKIPTTMGMPLTVTIKAPIAWSLKGKLQASMESPKSFKVQAQLKPSAVAQLLCKVEAWSPIVNTGIKIKSKAKLFTPIDVKVEVDLSTKPISIKASIKPPTQKRDLLVLESRPISYTQEWQRYVRNVDQGHEEKTIMGEEQNRVSTYNQCFGRETLGVQICARGQVHRTPDQSVTGTPFTPFSGPNKIVVTSEPGQDAPEEIHLKLSGNFQQLNANEMRKPQFSHFQDQNQNQNQGQDDSSSSSSSELQSPEQGSQEQPQQQQSREQQQQRRQQQQPSRSQSPINRRSSQQNQRQQGQRQNQDQRQQGQQGQQGQGQQNRRSTFQQVLQQYRNYEMKKGYRTQIRLEMEAGRNRKVDIELSHLYDSNSRYGQVNMKVQRQRPSQWEACFDGEMMLPQRPQFAEDVKEKKILASAQLKWGQSCNSQNYIQLTTRAERSTQQMEWEKRQNQYQQYRSDKCQNKAWCSPLTQEDFVEKIGQMLKYRVDIDYQNVPPQVQNATNKLYRALKHYYYWQTDVDQFTQNQQNKIRAEFVLDAQTKQRLNVTVKTPKETIKIQDMPLSQSVGAMNQKQSVADQLREYVQDDENQAECSITGKNGWQRRSQVESFDGTKFSAPFTSCWVVLAKDCGSEQPKFVVMARKSERGQSAELKEVKIITKRHRIHLKPENDEYDSVKVEVNGRPYDPENEDDITENGQVFAQIDKQQSTIQVQLPKTGVEVEFDGYAINVKLDQAYRGQQCGLCGHFDLESTDEFRNPDFTDEQDLRQFYMNYLIKDGQCQPPKQLTEVCESEECDKSEQSSSSSSSSSSGSHQNSESNEEQENPELQTKVIEMDDQLCFSTVPVPQCDEEDSYPMGVKEQKKVAYVCIDQDSRSAESIERQVRYGRREIPALKNRTPSFTRTENVPAKCQKYTRN
jgi:hypothetical protein